MRLKTDLGGHPPRPFLRGGTYYIRIRFYGRDVWRSLKTGNKKEAEEQAYKRWYAEQSTDAKDCLDLPDYTYDEVWNAYEESERYKLLKTSTKNSAEARWLSFASWAKEHKLKSTSLTSGRLLEYLNKRGTKNKTFNNVRNDLYQIFRAFELKTGFENPLKNIPSRITSRGEKASSEFRSFSDEEIQKILSGLSNSRLEDRDEWQDACHIAIYTGLRYKDIALLDWESINLETHTMSLIPCKTETKTGFAVDIRIAEPLFDLFTKLSKNGTTGHLLPKLASKYDEKHATQIFTHFLRRIGVLNSSAGIAGFHSFRSTFTTRAASAGVDVKKLGGILGHTSEIQTKHYNKSALDIDLSVLNYSLVAER